MNLNMRKWLTRLACVAIISIFNFQLSTLSAQVTVGGNVFGGGNLANVGGNSAVLLDQQNAEVTGDVYGGGALANVGTNNANTTTVTLLQGAVSGDVYGGGLGRVAKDAVLWTAEDDRPDGVSVGDVKTPAVSAVEALVNGVVTINIGSGTVDNVTGFATTTSGSATIGGSVYGCNNVYGTPKDNVFVNIYQTAHTAANAYPDPEPSEEAMVTPAASTAFAIKAVYGGGNQAAYAPVDNTKAALVHIYTCANTIQTVYGGGNAANATKVGVTIDGGRFDRVFGGGNGYSETGNHNDPTAPNYNPGANISVSATTQIHGGLYRQVFGGSNQYGDVANASLTIDRTSPCSELIAEAFGGANEADITGDVTTTLACGDVNIGTFYGGSNLADIINGDVTLNVYGGTYTNVFGGSKGRAAVAADPEQGIEAVAAKVANIDGDVILNLYGGTMVNAFGGSDVNGNITGKITVNVLDFETPTCGLTVNNIYGGGRDAAYTPTTPGAYPEVNIIHGHITTVADEHGNVFGGGKGEGAVVTSNPKVTIGYDATTMSSLVPSTHKYKDSPENFHAVVDNSVYGSGYAAAVTGNTTVEMKKANSSAAKLFGGGANAGVTGNTSVTLTDGLVKDGIFGGSDTTGIITGNTVIALNGGNVGTSEYSANYDICGGGWGLSTRVGGNVSVTLNGSTVYSDIYGGSYYGDVNTNSSNTTTINLTSGSIDGHVYGGGFGDSESGAYALVNGAVTVNANGATVNGNIFGCNNDNGAPQSTVAVNFTGGSAYGVFGGGNLASYGGTPVITVSGGTITKRVIGGGYAAGVGGSSITISNGAIATEIDQPGCGVFGGCFTSGEVAGAITVSVTGGTIGTDATHRANLHGGGYGHETSSTGDVTVTFGNSNVSHQNSPVLYGDIYGGSGFGDVNENTSNTTTVNILNGEITGDVYGGGLGQTYVAEVGSWGDPDYVAEKPAYAALVNGDVIVNIGAEDGTGKVVLHTYNEGAKGGCVFGGNNTYGTPKGNVSVNIYATDHGNTPATNAYPTGIITPSALETNAATQTYAIRAIFGGGNLASYEPEADKSATVHVYYCDNTIKDVYGGGNAANVGTDAISANTFVVIDGGRIHRVFGGGNGEVTPANIYGTATTTVNAGLIDQVFGCGNMEGAITATDLILTKASGVGACSDEVIGEVFGGANQAALTGNLSTTIDCGVENIGDLYGGSNKASIDGNVELTIKGGTYSNVYGGSKGVAEERDGEDNITVAAVAANIAGDVTLNLYGGTIGNAFGGSNANGNITGVITVNVLNYETVGCGLSITNNIYGAGNLTPYTPTDASTMSPVVNVMHVGATGSIGGNVYGGGKGSTATVTANPTVHLGYDATTMSSLVPGSYTGDPSDFRAVVTGNVFGGGDAAAVTGNTAVTMQKSNSQVALLFGGGNKAGVSGNANVTLTNGTVSTGLYGGCNATGTVGGDITIVLDGGTVGTNGTTTNTVFGGGYGHPTSTTGDITLTLDGTTVYGNLYGGSALGSVGAADKTTTVNINSNSLHGTLFGGGEGSGSDASTRATTNGNIVINYNSENTYLVDGIYGGANINGAVAGDIEVNVNANVGASGADGNRRDIFGGGLGQYTTTDGSTTVTVGASGTPVIYGDLYGGSSLGEVGASGKTSKADLQGGTLHGTLYGGGKGQTSPSSIAALVSGGSEAAVSGGTVSGGVYGGCNANGTVTQTSAVNITGGTIGADGATANVYGGGLGASTKVKGDVDVTINGASATIWGDVYGGSAKGLVNCNDAGTARTEGATTDVTLTAGTLHGSLYGGGHGIDAANADVWGPVQVTVNGGTVTDEIYGCNNAAGTPKSTVAVDIYGTDQPDSDYALGRVFGGGNAANYAGTPVVKVHNCDNKIEYVYGGGNAATVNGTNVTIYGGNTIGNVFGGCYGANVNGNTLVNLYGGDIDNVFGGNNVSGAISGTITVNINSVVDADPNGSSTACPMNARNVFGGGNLAAYDRTPDVNILGGTAGNVFGGGNEATVNGTDVDMTGGTVANIYGGGNEAGVTTSTDVNISGGLVTTGIYGGCNTTGTVGTNSTIALLGGQVGTNAVRADICGGGYGEPTKVDGNVQITMGNAAGTATPIIYGNLYGGSALGNVNTNSDFVNVGTNDYVNETNTTTIDLLSGTFTGNVFGGGLGRQAIEDDPETGEDESAPAIAALVHGVVQINIGRNTGTNESPVYTGAANLKNASIYGCNNVNGSPQSDVHIDVYATAHPTQTLITDTTSERSYAIANLYGGGNRANYEPKYNTPYSTSEWNLMKLIYVHVHGCDNTIGEFFGGGNAADVDGDSVIIDGGRFNEVFGGGNGAAKAANIGKGGIHLEVKAGRVGYLFEECNKRGNLVSGAPKHYKHGGGSCNDGVLQIDYHFCGGNIQDVIGDSTYTFTCAKNVRYVGLYGGCRLGCHYGNITLIIEGGTIQEVYGGSQGSLDYSADVRKYPYLSDVVGHESEYPEKMKEFLEKPEHKELQGTGGNVTVIIKGGKIGSVFGGCNTRGNVEGRITIIIDSTESDACPLDLDYVYGGGNLAVYEPDTVTNSDSGYYNADYPYPHIDLQNGHVNFDVFGGGHGADSNLTAGLVVANPNILMTPDVEHGKNFWVKGNIYGGGEMGSVGDYTRDGNGKPTACTAGKTTIAISAGRVGPSTLTMPTFKGHVFGGSKGTVGDTSAITGQPLISHLAYVNNTDITISGTAFIKGSVYGGGESGRVFHDTYVKIQGGQIGCGDGETGPYSEGQFINPLTTPVTNGNALAECNHWDYGDGNTPKKYDPYDPYEHPIAHDGHTFYGNVFGGGSGMMPYKSRNKANTADSSIYIQTSGRVCGNTKVEVTGGHILTSLYGGCEMGDVTGDSCVVTFGGTATLGVPRTLAQIADHPVTCYLFGAGKGDERVRFNTCTNVENVRVTVNGGIIYGSVFGGGEDGHVMKDVKVEIKSGATIGTWGTSYVDGNIFGGGRGFSGNALTAGNVGGDVLVNITGGTMLGSIYGGGRLASVGYGLYPANDARYGVMRSDNQDDAGNEVANFSRGHITVNIGGNAVIGNDNVNGNGDLDYRSEHPYGGNVFGGSMGRLVKMDGNYILNLWSKLGCAKQTEVNISGNAQVKSNVYGGSEMGSVTENTKVSISGTPTIGRLVSSTRYHGNVYGGGYGSVELTAGQLADQARRDSTFIYAGRTYGNTQIDITGGTLYGTVYGGGEMAYIGDENDATKGNTLVNIGLPGNDPTDASSATGSATIHGEVYGANNINGTPFGSTAVHIYKTAHSGTNSYPSPAPADAAAMAAATSQTYALSAVYGGGNKAEHAPIADDGTTLVYVHYCDENTIDEVYGGGNAANTKNNSVIIDGGRIHSVFGGGNGYSATKNHDNPSAPNYNPGAAASGIATTAIHGGLIDTVYGGSNQYGYINQINLIIDHIRADGGDPECAQIVGGLFGAGNESFGGGGEVTIACGTGYFSEVYGGANMADIGTALNPSYITLNVQGGTLDKVFGGSKGDLASLGAGHTDRPANIYGDITVNVTGGTIGYVYGGSNYNGNITGSITVNIDSIQSNCPLTIANNVYGASYITMYQPTDRTVESPVVNIKHGTVGLWGGTADADHGNVYGGGHGQGSRTCSNPAVYISNGDYTTASIDDPTTAAVETNTIALKPVVKGNVYGGGMSSRVFGHTRVDMLDGTVEGSIYAASKGLTYAEWTAAGVDEKETRAIVDGWTTLNMRGGLVKDCLYGGGELGQVGHLSSIYSKYDSESAENKAKYGNAYVTMTGGIVGAEGAAATHGNVYGGGMGNNESPLTGRVQGNTFVTITDGLVRHNVYGGGSLASVGTFTYDDDKLAPGYHSKPAQQILSRTAGTGTATVYITGGTIGTNGHENGMVFGSSRGDIDAIGARADTLAWAYNTKVTIGDTTNEVHNMASPQIKGSVYGGGENGHVKQNAYVHIYSGQVGYQNEIEGDNKGDVDKNDPTYEFRGNVYGAGCGTDKFFIKDSVAQLKINEKIQHLEKKAAGGGHHLPGACTPANDSIFKVYDFNMYAGVVQGNTHVKISGGHIFHNVYGGGAMANVGSVAALPTQNTNENHSFALSYPNVFVFDGETGYAYIDITGGRIGTMGSYDGDVFGGARGEAGDRYKMARYGNVRTAVITINYPTTAEPANALDTFGVQECITGSVYGGGENGHINDSTFITLTNGLVGHALYGGGKGKGTYLSHGLMYQKDNADGHKAGDDSIASIYSLTAGKVYGNTRVVMNGGHVVRNVFGGGNQGSVGKGNYYGGLGDYNNAIGYGELLSTAADTTAFLPLFRSSGTATVIINDGIVGMPRGDKDNLPIGNVFGGARGSAPPDIDPSLHPRILYYPTFFSGYVNRTRVTIGDGTTTPRIYGSVYGGGMDGHVRWDSYVRVRSGEIGNPYNSPAEATTLVGTADLDNLEWKLRGNVYGSGSGLGLYDSDGDGTDDAMSYSSGSVTHFTKVDIEGGTIHRNVYGGGSLATVGPPNIPASKPDATLAQTLAQVNIKGGTIGCVTDAPQGYGGNVFGGSRGQIDVDNATFSTVIYSEVNVSDGLVYASVYGGGEIGTIKQDAKVTVSGGIIGDTTYYNKPAIFYNDEDHDPFPTFLGHVYGGGKGIVDESDNMQYKTFNNVVNTDVNVTNGRIYGSIFGGSANGHVKGNTNVTVSGNPVVGTKGVSSWDGHVFGGGEGSGHEVYVDANGNGIDDDDEYDHFELHTHCGRVEGNNNITVSGGYFYGSIYGGGRLALTGVDEDGNYSSFVTAGVYDSIHHGQTTVNVSGSPVIGNSNADTLLASDFSVGDIFGSGRGDIEYYESVPAGRVANAHVNVIGTPTIHGTVFGGGEMAGVGYWSDAAGHPFAGQTGTTVVNVSGGTIGTTLEYTKAYLDAHIDDTTDWTLIVDGKVNHACTGNIIGASQGDIDITCPAWISMGRSRQSYVNISGDVRIMGNVYGGAEQGVVTENTHVNVSGGTIGTIMHVADSVAPKGVYHYGSVFGGGYGTEKYWKHENDSCTYDGSGDLTHYTSGTMIAGRVYGNTYVNVTGGQIIENVYGGGNMASVGYVEKYNDDDNNLVAEYLHDSTKWHNGVCKVVIGGTAVIGSAGLDGTEMNGEVYGAGKGVGNDTNEHFKIYSNVNSTDLTVNGGFINGSTFGGGADCHVLGNTKTLIQAGANIGSGQIDETDLVDGYSGYEEEYDGCVIGGGRNALNVNHTAGRVQGNTYVKVTGGRIKRSVIGGGALARTGVDVNGLVDSLLIDVENNVYDSTYHGSTFVDVSGDSLILTPAEFTTNTVNGKTYEEIFKGTTGTDGSGNVIVYRTTIGAPDGPILVDNDYTIGDIFGGGKGDTKDTVDFMAGRVMNTHVKVHGYPRIMADVYAGAEMASVGWWDTNRYVGTYGTSARNNNHDKYYTNTGYTKVTITDNPKDGTPYEFSEANIHYGRPWTLIDSLGKLYHTCSGSVYGGGQGYVEETATHRENWVHMGRVRKTDVNISGGRFMGNVFGGGSRGVVKEDCWVTITGGSIGCEIVDTRNTHGNTRYYVGSVFGGGYGNPKKFSHINDSSFVTDGGDIIPMIPTEQAGRVYGNTHVNISGGHIWDCVYGGGDMASTGYVKRDTETGKYKFDDPDSRSGGICYVEISGKTIVGPLDGTGQNAYVYGAGRGIGYDPSEEYKLCANVNETQLTVNLNTTGAATKTPAEWNQDSDGGRIWGSLFGGGADSHVLGDVSTTVNSGVIGTDGSTSYDGNIFGGGRNYLHTNSTNGRVQGNITVTVTHGTLRGSIFGGGRLAQSGVNVDGIYPATDWDSADHGNVTINVNTADGPVSIGNNNSRTLLQSYESNGDIFGSGKGDTKDYELVWAGQVANVYINVTGSPRLYGSIFGGGEMASLGYWDTHGDFLDGTGYSHIKVGSDNPSATDNPIIGTPDEYDYNVYTASTNPGEWTIYDDAGVLVHCCTGNIFGGCQGDVDLESPNWVTLARGRAAEVTVNHGTIMGSVFGAAEQGVMTGNTRVTINGGTIAANVPANALANFGVYGGGYGSDDPADNASVANDSTDARIALGLPWTADYMAGRLFGNATVNILGGTVKGNVYGGGQMAYIGDDKPTASRSAIPGVNGITLVNIGLPGTHADGSDATGSATIDGEVFGANNLMGSPYGNTEVNIYRTAHTTDNTCPTFAYTKTLVDPADELTEADVEALSEADDHFAIKAVYGGGNKASHTPLADDGTTLVHIWYCEENTVKAVYGGGNAADTKNNHIIIDGGRIDEVFGGGNGAGEGNPGANVVGTGDAVNANGTAWTQIHGGLITDVFGGSNSKGNIGQTILDIEKDGDCDMMVANTYGGGNEAVGGGGVINLYCGTHAGNFYGGSRNADLVGDVVLNIYGGTYENVFGGSKGRAAVAADPEHGIEAVPVNPANITGNVTVNVFGGNIQNLYGGSDICGNITGKITVNIDLDSTYNCPDGLRLNKVYGAGNLAVYFPDDPTLASPEINIINDTATYTTVDNTDPLNPVVTVTEKSFGIRTVFGGGFGDGTTHSYYTKKPSDGADTLRGQVFANPVVNIGGIEQKWDKTQPGTGTVQNPFGALVADDWRINRASIRGNIYGGGEAAPVTGNTMVTLHSSRITKITGTAPNLDTTFALKNHDTTHVCGSVFGGGYGPTAVVDGNTTVGIFGDATVIDGNVYGGGEAAILTGSTDVQVGYERIFITQQPKFTVTKNGGTYDVEIYSATPGATLYYTTDGSDPTTSSSVYSTKLTGISAGTTVKAIAVKPGYVTAIPAVTKVSEQ